ncbi:MAG: DUF309 domain-containing protein [candidate division NC10 bacterium]|nr:DUF309 domain-containing protein [candidate division NC10 bacterium]MBI4414348.1 DUF309 domain-containing protein [candidate division NC10 bacterium]
MRFPKPLRDPLAHLVVSAVTDPTSAAPLWAFRHFCHLALRSRDGGVPIRTLESPLPRPPWLAGSPVGEALRGISLLAPISDGRLALAPPFARYLPAVVGQVEAYWAAAEAFAEQGGPRRAGLARALECGATLYNARLYFETHELLEEIWAEQPQGRDRIILQGIIQAAVGLYHFQHGNWRGGIRVLGYGLSKAEAGRPVFYGLAMENLLDGLAGCRLAAQAVLAGDRAAFPWETVPPMRFTPGGEAP